MSHGNLTVLSAKSLLYLTLLSFILLAGCKTQEVQTYWSAAPVKVDGEMTEWPSGSTAYFEDLGVQLGLRNDDQNLYVLFRFKNQTWARAIRMGGVTLWLDNSGKNEKDVGIRYTGGPSISDLPMPGASDPGGFRQAMTPEQRQRLTEAEKTTADRITVIDKKENQETILSTDGSGGPAVSFASSQGIYSYEFSIPLKKADVFDFGIAAEPGQVISLGLEWGGIGKEDRERMMKRMGDGPLGGMRGGPPGNMGGGFGPQAPEKQELWVKTRLASPVER